MARRLIPPNGVRAADAVESSVGREGALGPWRAAGYGRRQQGRGGAGIGVRAEGARPLSGALRVAVRRAGGQLFGPPVVRRMPVIRCAEGCGALGPADAARAVLPLTDDPAEAERGAAPAPLFRSSGRTATG
ncbi:MULTISPECIES: hypothetical protein [Streptomyces]|uniref:Uncharacterized protein n=1 Tax=Streptomyces clavifer TaxID=68188 RepID=A0ABS4V6Y2_9ACTN|nr:MULTISPECIES: hypothetical protein [Streptomyces]MBP2359667.1 hypothetical protein [Streptomyces clavifer]MDX2745150.1 hypothetical protein [Streptomyces sp. NRRL_B-2557]GHA78977.1 hypothetical protein GCM10010392_00280 [Streptomyces clavifer]